MKQVTQRVFAETGIRGCNPGYVVTSDGVVIIDTPQLPTYAVNMRKEAEAKGPIRYIINTEHHVDHIFGNYYFAGTGIVVAHIGVYERFMTVTPELNPYRYAKEAIPSDDPAGEAIFPDEATYFAHCNKPSITFDGNLTLRVGQHTFELLHTPGHTPGQIAVYVPEEKVLFVGDTIFNQCQTWHYASDIELWIKTLERLKKLDVELIIPGHGPICTKQALDEQKAFLLEWLAAIAAGVAKGWSKAECLERITFKDRFPVDIGQEYMLDFVMQNNVSVLYDKMTQ